VLREQHRLFDYAAEQGHYYYNILTNWNRIPQNLNLRRPVHPRPRKHHNGSYFRLFDFDQDDDPPRYEEAHWHEQALALLNAGVRAYELPEELLRGWRQWITVIQSS